MCIVYATANNLGFEIKKFALKRIRLCIELLHMSSSLTLLHFDVNTPKFLYLNLYFEGEIFKELHLLLRLAQKSLQ